MRILIIEDEHYASKRLETLIQDIIPEGRILEVIDTVEHAIDWLSSHVEPNLIFMDIQLADGLSFQIFKAVTLRCPIIFTTAYDEYAIQAFKVNSIDYLLKPIEEEHFTKAIKKYKSIYADGNSEFDWSTLSHSLLKEKEKYKSRFLVKTGSAYSYLKTDKIKYIFSEDGLSFAIHHDDKKYVLDKTLDKIEEILNPESFFRINRKYIVCLDQIKMIHQYFNNRLKIDLKTKHDIELIVSREKVKDFKNWLDC